MSNEEPGLPSSGKRSHRPLTASVGGTRGTISIKDQLSGKFFLVDSGANECVFPASPEDRSLPQSTSLVAANGSSISTFGKRTLPLNFGGVAFSQEFWIASVSRPILGADFFSGHGLLIDMSKRCLRLQSGSILKAVPSPTPSICGLRLPTSGPYEALLEDFPSLLVQNFRGSVKHKICLLYTSPSPRD